MSLTANSILNPDWDGDGFESVDVGERIVTIQTPSFFQVRRMPATMVSTEIVMVERMMIATETVLSQSMWVAIVRMTIQTFIRRVRESKRR